MTKPRITFDDITFASEGELWEFLKHQYFAHKSHIALLKRELDAEEDKTQQIQLTIIDAPEDTIEELNECRWTDEGIYWEAECGFDFILLEGTPIENEMNFCPNCGRPIEV